MGTEGGAQMAKGSKNEKAKASRRAADEIVTHCWCGAEDFAKFGPDYLECRTCGTLVSQKGLPTEALVVNDDDVDYYGKNYWLSHQEGDLDLPSFASRARSDLPERNLHWLRALLKYALPPARVLELGCAHGGFVKLMAQAGYEASGMEMSPWVVQFARDTFGVDVLRGPVEQLGLPTSSYDAIALMDVIEHLPDAASTMRCCLDLLRPGGFLLIQMPEFREGMDYEALVAEGAPFLQQLKSDEHLFLYSRRSITELFLRLGAPYIRFEDAIFSHYDTFFVVGRQPLTEDASDAGDAALMASADGRVALALIDVKDQALADARSNVEGDEIRAALFEQYAECDVLRNQRNLREAQLSESRSQLCISEADRDARLAVIEAQGAELSGLQSEADAIRAELAALTGHYDEVQRDRAARLAVIEAQGEELGTLREEASASRAEATALAEHLQASEADRDARLLLIESQGARLGLLHAQAMGVERELQKASEELEIALTDRADQGRENAKRCVEVADLKMHLDRQGDELARTQILLEAALSENSAAANAKHEVDAELENLRLELSAAGAEQERLQRHWWIRLGRKLGRL